MMQHVGDREIRSHVQDNLPFQISLTDTNAISRSKYVCVSIEELLFAYDNLNPASDFVYCRGR